MKHRITINVSDPGGRKSCVLKGAQMRLPERLVKFLLGNLRRFIFWHRDRRWSQWM